MKITRLPKDTDPAAWNAILETGWTPDPRDEVVCAEWLVIGAGFAGLAAARRLAQSKLVDRVVLL